MSKRQASTRAEYCFFSVYRIPMKRQACSYLLINLQLEKILLKKWYGPLICTFDFDFTLETTLKTGIETLFHATFNSCLFASLKLLSK